MKHIILSYSPFTVKFIAANGDWKIEKYNVVLTTAEIKAEYDYIVFTGVEENIPDLEYPQ